MQIWNGNLCLQDTGEGTMYFKKFSKNGYYL